MTEYTTAWSVIISDSECVNSARSNPTAAVGLAGDWPGTSPRHLQQRRSKCIFITRRNLHTAANTTIYSDQHIYSSLYVHLTTTRFCTSFWTKSGRAVAPRTHQLLGNLKCSRLYICQRSIRQVCGAVLTLICWEISSASVKGHSQRAEWLTFAVCIALSCWTYAERRRRFGGFKSESYGNKQFWLLSDCRAELQYIAYSTPAFSSLLSGGTFSSPVVFTLAFSAPPSGVANLRHAVCVFCLKWYNHGWCWGGSRLAERHNWAAVSVTDRRRPATNDGIILRQPDRREVPLWTLRAERHEHRLPVFQRHGSWQTSAELAGLSAVRDRHYGNRRQRPRLPGGRLQAQAAEHVQLLPGVASAQRHVVGYTRHAAVNHQNRCRYVVAFIRCSFVSLALRWGSLEDGRSMIFLWEKF